MAPRRSRSGRSPAAGLIETDAYSAYVLAYDAARFACVALHAVEVARQLIASARALLDQLSFFAQPGTGRSPAKE